MKSNTPTLVLLGLIFLVVCWRDGAAAGRAQPQSKVEGTKATQDNYDLFINPNPRDGGRHSGGGGKHVEETKATKVGKDSSCCNGGDGGTFSGGGGISKRHG